MAFAKLFETKKGQVLLTKEFDGDETYELMQCMETSEMLVKATIKVKSEEHANLFFEKYTEQKAEEFTEIIYEEATKNE